ncbi:hypothetical protein GCM10009850_121610 [Nonomuraea monospora]|uniref:Uncharacterized protein n=1 Tax=Nonomuraea monospora TaxID=568818 RepID=A0ABN3D5E6_9ACTN
MRPGAVLARRAARGIAVAPDASYGQNPPTERRTAAKVADCTLMGTTSTLTVWIAPVLGLLGALLGGFLAPWVNARLSHATARRTAFDNAISAIRTAQVVRHRPVSVQAEALGGDVDRAREFSRELVERGLERFIESQQAAIESLAQLEPHYVPRHSARSTWEITEPEAEALIKELVTARDSARFRRKTRSMSKQAMSALPEPPRIGQEDSASGGGSPAPG